MKDTANTSFRRIGNEQCANLLALYNSSDAADVLLAIQVTHGLDPSEHDLRELYAGLRTGTKALFDTYWATSKAYCWLQTFDVIHRCSTQYGRVFLQMLETTYPNKA